jgi:hypothetical protein
MSNNRTPGESRGNTRGERPDQLAFYYPPAATAGLRRCLAPLCHVGCGTGTAAVIDQRSGRRVAFRTPTIRLHGPRGVACVECESELFVDGVHLAVLPDGQRVWVRDVRDTLAGGEATDTAGDGEGEAGEAGDSGADGTAA